MSIEEQSESLHQIVVEGDQPLVSIPTIRHDGTVSVTYLVDDDEIVDPMPAESVAKLRSLAGVWNDISWEEMEADLHRIRHESVPTPPLEP